ncbi:putative Zn-dependent dehydrogenase [Zalerion maritima]|uniref:Zn-dependent dehydrogenase n=1 Tax=Zalerion maritima TaxID=339359 RepID=A0AAD5RTP9_9PEZI|nr:putative Zn-dependent dehydrogenase [Zalerion maritima]
MATARLAGKIEQAIGHDDNAVTQQDVASYREDGAGDPDETMKALVWRGKGDVRVESVPAPRILEPTDVLIKVTGSTICGSDLHLLHGAILQMSPGDILGHEFMGVVHSVGAHVDPAKVTPGKRYVASFQIACGSCFFCDQKLSSQCEKTNSNSMAKGMYGGRTAGIFGYSHFVGGFAGGQAEWVRVPWGEVNLLEIPDGVEDEKALFLSDVLCTAYNAVKDTRVYEGDTVAVFGCGPIGQMAARFALMERPKKVILVDTEPRLGFVASRWPEAESGKLELVDFQKLSSGATRKDTVVSKLKELTEGRGPDVAIECAAGEYAKGWLHKAEIALGAETDTSEILNEMVEGVRNYGRVGVTGVYVGYTNHFAIGSLMQRGIRLIGNGQAPVHKYWKELLGMIQSGQLDPLQMVSHRVRLEDMDKVYKMFDAREESMQKVFVQTKWSAPRAEGSPELSIL